MGVGIDIDPVQAAKDLISAASEKLDKHVSLISVRNFTPYPIKYYGSYFDEGTGDWITEADDGKSLFASLAPDSVLSFPEKQASLVDGGSHVYGQELIGHHGHRRASGWLGFTMELSSDETVMFEVLYMNPYSWDNAIRVYVNRYVKQDSENLRIWDKLKYSKLRFDVLSSEVYHTLYSLREGENVPLGLLGKVRDGVDTRSSSSSVGWVLVDGTMSSEGKVRLYDVRVFDQTRI